MPDASHKLILAFVALILGAVLIGTIATNSLAVSDKTVVVDEAVDISSARIAAGNINTSVSNFTVANNPTSWKKTDCPLTSVTYGNASTDFVLDTDYNLDTDDGIITVLNTTTTINSPNATLADYTYCGDDYLNLTWGRTIVNLLAGFFALALLGVAVGLFYSVAKDYNIV